MEKNIQVLGEKINLPHHGQASYHKNQSLPKHTKDNQNSIMVIDKAADDIEKQMKINHSNYRSFLWKWHKNPKYPLPYSFKIIQISNLSEIPPGNDYEQLNFPILSYSGRQLSSLAVQIIKSHQFETICSTEIITELVNQICAKYNIVSYHNFSHGFSLMHMLYHLVKMDKFFFNLFTFQEIGFSLIAALAHDLGHFGTNNALEVKKQTQLAKYANNEAVLQKMHIKVLFDLLKQKNIDIFAKSTNPQKMKQLMTKNILATDFSQHFKNLERFKQLISKINQNQEIEDSRYFYMTQAFHACDIGNPCLEHQEYMNWAALLTYQFNTQTLIESENNYEVTEMLRYKSLKCFYQGQIGFINNFVYPLWKELSSCWTGFNFLVQNIQTNLKILQIKSQKQSNDK